MIKNEDYKKFVKELAAFAKYCVVRFIDVAIKQKHAFHHKTRNGDDKTFRTLSRATV